MTAVITVEPFGLDLAAAHEASRGVTHQHDAPPARLGSLVITERCGDWATILSAAAECPNGVEAAAQAWAEATGATYERRAA